MHKVWQETSYNGAFYAYNRYLRILIDIIINYDYLKMPPRLFQIIAENLNKVLLYGSEDKNRLAKGDSWDATETWHKRKYEIDKSMIKQLYYYSNSNYLMTLRRLIKNLID